MSKYYTVNVYISVSFDVAVIKGNHNNYYAFSKRFETASSASDIKGKPI